MTAHDREVVTWVLGTLLTALILVGFLVRYALLPWLNDHVVHPVADVQRQVTQNEHVHETPTLPDRLEDVSAEIAALATMFEGHLLSSDRWLDAITSRLAFLEGHLDRVHPRHRDDDALRPRGDRD